MPDTQVNTVERAELSTGARLLVATFALIGLMGVVPVSMSQFTGTALCPHLGPVPLCHIVAVGYAAILLSALPPFPWRPTLFLTGWLPVFLLAATGTGLELLGHQTCPRTAGGWPKCYFSLALATAVIAPVALHWVSAGRHAIIENKKDIQ